MGLIRYLSDAIRTAHTDDTKAHNAAVPRRPRQSLYEQALGTSAALTGNVTAMSVQHGNRQAKADYAAGYATGHRDGFLAGQDEATKRLSVREG